MSFTIVLKDWSVNKDGDGECIDAAECLLGIAIEVHRMSPTNSAAKNVHGEQMDTTPRNVAS